MAYQVRTARERWRSIRAVFTRTMFKPTYGTFGCACCANESHFFHFNNLLRRQAVHVHQGIEATLETLPPTTTPTVDASGASGGGDAAAATGASRLGACEPMHVLDLQRMMLCNNSVGTCSSRTGWSADGLHPSRAVYLQYLSLSMMSAADLGEVCAPEGTGGRRHRRRR